MTAFKLIRKTCDWKTKCGQTKVYNNTSVGCNNREGLYFEGSCLEIVCCVIFPQSWTIEKCVKWCKECEDK